MATSQFQSLNAHAKQRLTREKTSQLSRKEKLELYRRFLKTEEHRIKLYHRSGGSGMRVSNRRAELLVILLHHLYLDAVDAAAGGSPGVTLVAIGGFGRGRLNPCSDIDLLFLHPRGAAGLPPLASQMIEDMLYMLYDCGFKVGHSVRSIRETIKEANSDDRTKSSIIESRLLFGDEKLYVQMLKAFNKHCINGYKRNYLKTRLEDIRLRHLKHSGTPLLQEPHIKEGCGGLRDYHNLIWISYVRRGTIKLSELIELKLLTTTAYREMRKAYDFLLRVRTEMHYIQKRSTDILTLRLQGDVAKNLGYPQRDLLRKIEAFMRDYYTHTSNLFQRAAELGDHFYLEEREKDIKAPVVGFLARRKFKVEHFDGFIAKNNRIYYESKTVFKEDPDRLMRIFQHAQLRHLRLAPPLFSLIQRSWNLIDRRFRYRDSNRDTFEAILSRKGDVGRALRQMHRAGVLGRYIPEFGALTNLVQHEFFHRYPADEHTLRVIEELDALSGSDDRRREIYRDLFNELDDPYVIYLAILLHDSGRAKNRAHHDDESTVLAQRIARRFSLKTKRRRLLLFLVDSHLELWRTASSKDIDDPQTIASFAQIIGSQRQLDHLMLLTYADSRGTNEESWTETKETPLRILYHETREYLEDAAAFAERRSAAQKILLKEVLEAMPESHASTVVAHFQEMPARYFMRRESMHIIRHIELLIDYFKNWAFAEVNPEPILYWRAIPEQGCSEFTVIWHDRHKLLAHIAGALASHKVNILSAEIIARGDDVVFDIFRICTTNFEPVNSRRQQENIENLLRAGLRGEETGYAELIDKADDDLYDWHDLADQFPQRVYLNNDSNKDCTLLEIQAIDRLGLLHNIFSAIGKLGLEVTNARITTTRGAAIDTIYIVDSDGNKIIGKDVLAQLLSDLQGTLGIAVEGNQ
ncbi:MAG: [protein-PII] uridylyltransferase [Verrucomicrobiales bacterium]